MPDIINKSEIVRRLHDQGLSYVQIVKVTGIRYNMVYNIIDRYKTQPTYKAPVVAAEVEVPSKSEITELEDLVNGTLKEMGILWDVKTKKFRKEEK